MDHAKAVAAGVAAAKKLLAAFPVSARVRLEPAKVSRGGAWFPGRGKIRLEGTARSEGWFGMNGARLRLDPTERFPDPPRR